MALVCLPAASRAQDDFVAQHDAVAGLMRDLDPIAVAFVDGGPRFHVGEPIRLSLTFRPIGLLPVVKTACYGIGLEVVLERTVGTADPMHDARANGVVSRPCGVGGYYAAGFERAASPDLGLTSLDQTLPLPIPPQREAVTLNEAVRFDREGRYRFYLRSRHWLPLADATPPRLSNILEVEIVRDPAWEAREAADIRRAIELGLDPAAKFRSVERAAFLATDAAVDLMLEHRPPTFGPGLYGARNRPYVIAKMSALLDEAAQPVNPSFVAELTVLDLTHRSGGAPIARPDFDATQRSYSERRFRALAAAGRLEHEVSQAMRQAVGDRMATGTQVAWQTHWAAFPAFPEVVERALTTLSPPDQRTVLDDRLGWREFADPAFVPMFRRMVARPVAGGPHDLALAMLFILAPAEARAVARRELARPASLFGLDGLRGLGDTPLPEFDRALAARLEHGASAEQRLSAMALIERFATDAIVGRVRRVFASTPSAAGCPLGPVALAYFFRVAPSYAVSQLERVAAALDDDMWRCAGDGLLAAVAARRMVPAVESAAIAHLADSRAFVRRDAAYMLGRYGSRRGERALWDALEVWHARLATRVLEFETWAKRSDEVEAEMAWESTAEEALAAGSGWPLGASSVARLKALCVTSRCRERATALANEGWNGDLSLSVSPPRLPLDEPYYFVERANTLVSLDSTAAVRAHIAAYPPGTEWRWQSWEFMEGSADDARLTMWLPGQEEAQFEAVRAFAAARGMRVERER